MSLMIVGFILGVLALLLGWLAWQFETRDPTELKLVLLAILLGWVVGDDPGVLE
jgi:hypothetical protein